MTRGESIVAVDQAIDHLMGNPAVLVDLAAGRRVFMVSEWRGNRGSIAFSNKADLSIGWREFARASDLVPFQIAIAKIGSSFKKYPQQSRQRKAAERFGWLLVGLARSGYLLVDLHQEAMNAEVTS